MARITISTLLLLASMLIACDEDDPVPTPQDAPGVCTPTGTAVLLADCTQNEECASCVCRTFGHENKCTKACSGPADCEAPSSGCTAGFCAP